MLCICVCEYIVTYIVITCIWGSESFLMSSVSWFLCTVEVFRID